MKDFWSKLWFFCRRHFAVRVRDLGSGHLAGCFGPVCFVLSVYRCGKHIAGADAVEHLKLEEIV